MELLQKMEFTLFFLRVEIVAERRIVDDVHGEDSTLLGCGLNF